MKEVIGSYAIAFLAFFFTGSENTLAQPGLLYGKVLDATTGKAIEYTSVLNYTRQTRIYSTTTGEFKQEAQAGDTLVLYALGYYYQKIIVSASMLNTSAPVALPLKQQAVEIAEVRIISLGTYEEFREQFMALDRPETKTERLAGELAQLSQMAAREAYEKAKAEQKLNGVTIVTVPILTPEEKERLLLARIIETERVHDQIYQKFNPVLIKKMTGLTDDDTIIEFMVFCGYSDAYLLQVNEYDLMVSIARKYELFKLKKEEDKSRQNRLYTPGDFYQSA